MTTLALAEHLRHSLDAIADRVETEQSHDRAVFLAHVGKQVFRITCEESVPDKSEPEV